MFSAIKLMQREIGPTHIAPTSAAIPSRPSRRSRSATRSSATACRSPAPPRSAPNMAKRPIAIMGDGGFWHNGLITGVASNLFNKGDGVLIVMQNGYTSATGQQYMPSSTTSRDGADARHGHRADAARDGREMAAHGAHLRRRHDGEDAEGGDAHRRARPQGHHRRRRMPARAPAPRARRGRRASSSAASASMRARYGVDDEICTGDHSCIRLSGCPSLTVKPSPDPLRTDPVATVIESCVGCGLCGEVAHAAVLCPSFYRAEIVRNADARWDRAALHRGHRLARRLPSAPRRWRAAWDHPARDAARCRRE